jgi:DNA polymerase-3 subunit gamma/tau
VRDGLSLLDRAIAHAEGEVTEAAMRELLGLADRTAIFDLFEAVLSGNAAAALGQLDALYDAGADPAVVVQDLLELTHWLTRVKVAPEIARDPGVPEAERERGRAFAEKLSMPALARAWQILLKGLSEVQTAPSGIAAAEMLLVRLAYAADLPTPAELVAALAGDAPAAPAPEVPPARAGTPRAVATAPADGPRPAAARPPAGGTRTQAALAEPAPAAAATPARAEPAGLADPRSFAEVVALFAQRREGAMQAHLFNNVHLVGFERGRIELRPTEHAPRDLPTRISELLSRWTGNRWVVAVSREAGQPTLAEQEAAALAARKAEAGTHPLVRAVLEAFPGATIEAVRGGAAEAAPEAEPEAPLEFTDADAAAGGEQEDSE